MSYFKEKVLGIGLLISIVGVVVHFSYYFNYLPETTDLTGWANTAIYFNNIFSPIFLLISVILIYLTWKTSKIELADTKILLNKQIQEQKFKNEFDIFAGRIRNLAVTLSEQPDGFFKVCIIMNLLTHIGPKKYDALFEKSVPLIFLPLSMHRNTRLN